MDRMSPLDASFLHVEDAVSHMHIGSVAVFEGPPPTPLDGSSDGCGQAPGGAARTARRCGSCPSTSAGRCGSTIPHFNLGYHLRHTALAAPGGDQELRNLVGRVMSQQLDRHKPLWEMWIVEGLEHDHWALVSKVHHCMVDGVSGTDLLTVVLDAEREPARPLPDDWHAEPEPGSTRLIRDAIVDLVASPYEQIRAVRSATRAPRQVMQQIGSSRRGCERGRESFVRRRRRRSTVRSAPIAAGTGRARRSPMSRPCGARWAALSTTSC